nr:alpha-amylase family protein [Armatimonadota bacterium]
VVPLLPSPMLIHVSDYLHGGFDKQYPDHLPPNPVLGTPAEFRQFIDAVHQSGDLFMPYTNPTWWCDHPRGPTFMRAGDAPLLKDRQGKPVREAYGANDGWSLTTFHPAALAAEKTILDQFTQEYPSDVLFQDQIGARSPQYDFNPASPTPDAYTEGMIGIARRDSQRLPLGTENGFDGILNWETQFCGLAWGLVPTEGRPDWAALWRNQYPADTWRFAPLALWLGHDKALFVMHDLGQFVTNRETLAWVMALGYQISATGETNALRRPENRQWLAWLAVLQKAVGPDILGAPLNGWREAKPGVYRAQYGQTTVIANTTAQPFPLDANTTLAAYGFSVMSPASHVTAGWFARYDGYDYGEQGLAFVRQGAHLDVYAPPGTTVRLPNAAPITLPSGEAGVTIPPALRGVAPRDRPRPPQYVGVLAMPWMTSGWASTTSEQWLQGLTAAHLPLTVRPLATYAQLKEALVKPDDCLAIVNPYGEHFPTAGPGQWKTTLEAVRDYCAHGGAWIETSAHPFYQAIYPLANGKSGSEQVGAGGLELLGYNVADLGDAPPPTPLTVTLDGRAWLGEALSRQMAGASAVVNRPFASGAASLTLVRGSDLGYFAGVQPGGWGWLWRFGGSDPPAALAVPVVAALCQHLFTTPPTSLLVSPTPRFYALPLH